LVEFALVLPLFVLMLFGMIEAGWAFAQANDVRHGAREAARIAAVDATSSVDAIGGEVCNRMDLAGNPGASVTLEGVALNGDLEGGRNAEGRIVVSLTYSSITGAVEGFFGGTVLTSDIDFRLEQPAAGNAAWWDEVGGAGGSGSHDC
jgi:hypothetical protein